MKTRDHAVTVFRAVAAALLAAGLLATFWIPGGEHVMGRYATALEGRTRGQRRNAELAARRLDGITIEGGHVFSFNRVVGPWTADRGYVRAPVSYDGELVSDWGGGVCQTSSTLYNAALLAGLEVVERHRHTWAPHYVPPGQDAAVAQHTIDLRLRNPHPWPVRVRARVREDSLEFDVVGREAGPMATVSGERLATVPPAEIQRPTTHLRPGQRRVVNRGKPGARVAVYRTPLRGPGAGARTLVSRDEYPAMSRIVAVGSGEAGGAAQRR